MRAGRDSSEGRTPRPGLQILVVDDDPSLRELLRTTFELVEERVEEAASAEEAIEAIARTRPDVVVLDVGLPGIDGTEICRRLRAADDWTPILFVTARDEEVERVLGLEMGADDYLVKPFSPRELVARVKAVLRRGQTGAAGQVLQTGAVTLDPDRRQATVDGRAVELTATEFDLLAHLMRSPGRVFTRDQLLSAVWGYEAAAGTRTVDVHVSQLRTKLGDSSPIRTVRGVGYSVADR